MPSPMAKHAGLVDWMYQMEYSNCTHKTQFFSAPFGMTHAQPFSSSWLSTVISLFFQMYIEFLMQVGLPHDIPSMLRRTSESPHSALVCVTATELQGPSLPCYAREHVECCSCYMAAQGWRPHEESFLFRCRDPTTPIPVYRKQGGEASSRPVFLTAGTALS